MIAPTVHLNGTSGEELLKQVSEALHALREARDKLAAAYPHPRDYYVQSDPQAHEKASAAHQSRLTRVELCIDELEEISISIWDQLDREKRR